MVGTRLRDTEITGFVVLVRKTGKYFYLEYKSTLSGTYRKHPLGKWGDINAQQARELALITAGEVAKGQDPQQEKHDSRAETEKRKQEVLRVFLHGGYKAVTPYKTATSAIARIEYHFPDLLDKPMSAIKPWDLEQWKKAYAGKPSGANRILSSLRGVMTKAVKAGLLDKSPMPEVKKIKENKNKKARYLRPDEEKALRKALDEREGHQKKERLRYIEWCRTRKNKTATEPYTGTFTDYLKPMILLTLNTGVRRGELFNLRVSDIDFLDKALLVEGEEDDTITGSKTGQTRKIPLNEEALSVLTDWLKQTGNRDLVFESPKTGGRFDNIDSSWEELRASAGLSHVRFHDLRHTFGTRLAHKRVDIVAIKELMGHESLDTTARYLHASDNSMRAAVASLDVNGSEGVG